jgi:dihydrolipoyl dehydrogenase
MPIRIQVASARFAAAFHRRPLLHAARVLDEAKHATAYGVSFGKPSIDVDKLRAWKDQIVRKQTGGLGLLAKSWKVTHIQGGASFVNAKTLSVETAGGVQKVEANYVIVATGSRPTKVPNVSIDSPKLLDSTAALGSKVTVVEMSDGLLAGADRDLAGLVARRMETYAEAILLETRVASVEDDEKGLAVSLAGKNAPSAAQFFDRVLVAVGRRPNSAIARLDKTRAKVNQLGFIEVDGQRPTAEPSIFASVRIGGSGSPSR